MTLIILGSILLVGLIADVVGPAIHRSHCCSGGSLADCHTVCAEADGRACLSGDSRVDAIVMVGS